MIGTIAGSYRITSVLSHGGMGTVYRAEHTLIGRLAAVKVLHPEMSADQSIVQRFFNEAKATTSIQHPGIVEIYDFGNLDDDHAFIVMELLEGRTLAERNKARGRHEEGEAAALMQGVCSALAAAHAKGIIHRDLKPDNIFMIADPTSRLAERAKLLDFGIAKLSASVNSNATRVGTMLGTPTYMSPEQCKATGEIDGRADLYSLGCILYEMVAGRPPFEGIGPGQLIGAHMFQTAEPPTRHGANVSPDFEQLIMSLLSKEPKDRPASAIELGERLGAIAARTGWGTAQSWERPSMPAMPSPQGYGAPAAAPPPAYGAAPAPRPTPMPQQGYGAQPTPGPQPAYGAAPAPRPTPMPQQGYGAQPTPGPQPAYGAAPAPRPTPMPQQGGPVARPTPLPQGYGAQPTPAPYTAPVPTAPPEHDADLDATVLNPGSLPLPVYTPPPRQTGQRPATSQPYPTGQQGAAPGPYPTGQHPAGTSPTPAPAPYSPHMTGPQPPAGSSPTPAPYNPYQTGQQPGGMRPTPAPYSMPSASTHGPRTPPAGVPVQGPAVMTPAAGLPPVQVGSPAGPPVGPPADPGAASTVAPASGGGRGKLFAVIGAVVLAGAIGVGIALSRGGDSRPATPPGDTTPVGAVSDAGTGTVAKPTEGAPADAQASGTTPASGSDASGSAATGSGSAATGTGTGSAATGTGTGSAATGSGSASTGTGTGTGSAATNTGTGTGTGTGSAATNTGAGTGSATTSSGSGSGARPTGAGSGSGARPTGTGSGSGAGSGKHRPGAGSQSDDKPTGSLLDI